MLQAIAVCVSQDIPSQLTEDAQPAMMVRAQTLLIV